MRPQKLGVIAVLPVLFVLSCETGEGEHYSVCEPGETKECLCSPSNPGIQICNEEGSGWGGCGSCAGGCQPNCNGKTCGDDGCGGSCGICGEDCQPNCYGKSCGDDGCGGSCGYCASSQTCSTSGQCISPFETVYQNCIDGGNFLDLCLQDPPGFSCVAMCDYFTEMCGYTLCKDSVPWYQNCVADPQIPQAASSCHDLLCALFAAQYVGDYSGCPD